MLRLTPPRRLARATFAVAVLVLAVAAASPVSAADFYDPVGTHDKATCSTLAGWAKDGDTTLPTSVHVYKGAPFPFGSFVTATTANLFRADLPFVDKNHGFSIATPSAFFTGCPVKVYIHAIDIDTAGNPVSGGNNLLLNQTGKTIRCGPINPDCFPGPGGPIDP
jgi:hypothetical protein